MFLVFARGSLDMSTLVLLLRQATMSLLIVFIPRQHDTVHMSYLPLANRSQNAKSH